MLTAVSAAFRMSQEYCFGGVSSSRSGTLCRQPIQTPEYNKFETRAWLGGLTICPLRSRKGFFVFSEIFRKQYESRPGSDGA